MTGLHLRLVQLLNKGSDDIHVLDSVVKSLECFVALDVLVLRKHRGGLIRLHALEEKLKVVGVDVVPKSLFPGLKLTIFDRDEIPHLLELDKLVLAVVKLLLLCPLKFEELFEGLQFFSLLLHLAILDVVLANLFIGCINHLGARLGLS